MVDYQSSKIYKITNDINDEVYVGSTTQTLTKRFSYHIIDSRVKDKNHLPLYVLMNEIGTEHFCISLIEDWPCTNKTELRLREGHWIREIGTLNKKIAGRTKQEYRDDNRERLRDYHNEWREKNPEKRKETIVCECGLELRKESLARHKKSNEHTRIINNEPKMIVPRTERAYYKKLFEKVTCECGLVVNSGGLWQHKNSKLHEQRLNDAVPDKKMETMICECGSIVVARQLQRHLRTKKHIAFIEQKNTTALNNLSLD